MIKQEINQYLTEQVFGECWHEFLGPIKHSCKNNCGCHDPRTNNPDFFTHEGCMKLWLGIQEKAWFIWFTDKHSDIDHGFDLDVIHPDHLARAVYDFLQAKEFKL